MHESCENGIYAMEHCLFGFMCRDIFSELKPIVLNFTTIGSKSSEDTKHYLPQGHFVQTRENIKPKHL